jgi:prefoldin subunit 5
MPPTRSPEEIRRSLQATRTELEYSINDLQGKVQELTNWRRQLAEHRQQVIIGAAVAGFLIGGGVAATFGLFRRRR